MHYDIDIDSYIGYPISKQWVGTKLKACKGKGCAVRINSYGGDVQTALDIRQQFIDHGKVTAYVFGMTASAATILAMGAQRIKMSRYALMLIHPCSSYAEAWGNMNAEELAAAIKQLDKTRVDLETIDGLIVAIYAQRTKKEPADIAQTMKAAQWLTAEECKKLGLVDEIIEEGEQEPITASVRHQFAACGLPLPEEPTPLSQAEETTEVGKTDHIEEGEDDTSATTTAEEPRTAQSVLASIFDALCRFFSPANKGIEVVSVNSTALQLADKPNKEPRNINQPTPSTTDMDQKQYEALSLTLQLDSLPIAEDGTCNLTQEQMNALEDKVAAVEATAAVLADCQKELADRSAEVDDLKHQVAQLESQVLALKTTDGAETSSIVDTTVQPAQPTAAALYDSIKKYL